MNILHIAPHPDDETLGCGGSLFRLIEGGDAVHWLIVAEPSAGQGPSPDAVGLTDKVINDVAGAYGFAWVHRLRLPDSRLETLPLADIVDHIGAVVRQVEPSVVYVPFSGDVHSDHRVVLDAAIPCTKWFRYPSVRRVLAYETLSETNFGIDPIRQAFRPTVYTDISRQLERKLAIVRLYKDSEVAHHPFPRSEEAVRSLALIRGSEAGCSAAEAFMLLREVT